MCHPRVGDVDLLLGTLQVLRLSPMYLPRRPLRGHATKVSDFCEDLDMSHTSPRSTGRSRRPGTLDRE